jgi:hypothetical protein
MLSAWLGELQDLHEDAKRGTLAARDLAKYQETRDEVARMLLAAMNLALSPGQRPRRLLRVARELPVEVEFPDGIMCAFTKDLSAGGFGALLPRAPRIGDALKVTLNVPGGEPLHVTALVRGAKEEGGKSLVSFQFLRLDEAAVERLEMFVFDAILRHLRN